MSVVRNNAMEELQKMANGPIQNVNNRKVQGDAYVSFYENVRQAESIHKINNSAKSYDNKEKAKFEQSKERQENVGGIVSSNIDVNDIKNAVNGNLGQRDQMIGNITQMQERMQALRDKTPVKETNVQRNDFEIGQ